MTRFWHPMSNMGHTRDHRVIFVRGEGSRLWDRLGNTYLDGTAGLWYCNVGHGRAKIAAAIGDQAALLAACSCFDVYASDRTIELADRVAAMAPVSDGRVFLTSGGSDSIETAVKVARRFWSANGAEQKTVVISRKGCYHGLHGYGTSLAGIAGNRDGFGQLTGDMSVVAAMDPSALEAEIDRLDGRAAAFIAEPVIGAGGVRPPADGYLTEVARICSERDVLFMADEVITGFGRLGKLFGTERYGVRPDVLILAKGLTSGYQPLGAVVFSDRIAEPFWREDDSFWLRHGYTYSGHATACAAALANLDILEEEELVGRVAHLEPKLAEVMAPLVDIPSVSEVRTVGLLAGVQLSSDAVKHDRSLADRVVTIAREKGVITRKLAGDALQVSPPFVIELGELDQIGSTLSESIEAAGRSVRGGSAGAGAHSYSASVATGGSEEAPGLATK